MNVIDLIDSNAEKYPDHIAVCTMDAEVTFKRLKEKSEQAAACFQARGIGKGDSIALMSQNTFDFVFSFFGILKAGGIAVPVNHKLTAVEVDYILENSGAVLFLFDGSLRAVAENLTTVIPEMAMDTRADGMDFLGDFMDVSPGVLPG